MLKIAICDDEQEYRDTIEQMLRRYIIDIGLEAQVDIFINPSELIDATEGGTIYDIYLLDIYMPGITGMSFATELRSRDIKSSIIFLTSSTDHALEAFGVNATHYILKPFTMKTFYVGMDKAMQNLTTHRSDSIVIKVDHEYCNILVSNICYCEAEDKYQSIYLANGKKLLVRITGAELYKQLSAFDCFYHCGRSHIVNLNYISRLTQNGVILKNGVELSLPRAVIPNMRTAFFDYFN